MIIRAPRVDNFTILQNGVFDSNLSWRAIGLLAYLLSKPDQWKIKITDLIRKVQSSDNPTGRDATYAILKELIKAGYLVKGDQDKADNGKWSSANYYIYDLPKTSDEPCTVEPHTDQPNTVEPSALVSTDPEEGLKEGSTDLEKKAPPEKADLPEWLDPSAWREWLDHRKQIKHPVTDLAAKKAIAELSRLREQGHDPARVIEHSILNGWRGLFPPKPEARPVNGTRRHDEFTPPPEEFNKVWLGWERGFER